MAFVHMKTTLRSAALLSALLAAGCSLIVESDKQQCKADQDCRDKFGDDSSLVCSDGLCQQPSCTRDDDCKELGADYVCQEAVCKQPAVSREPEEWACLDTAREPMSLPGPFAVTLKLTHMVFMTPLKGVQARLCRTLDTDCASPEDMAMSDSDGSVTVNVSATFRGYVQLDTPGLMPTLYFFNPAIDHDQELGPVQMGPAAVGVELSKQAKAMPEQKADRGIVLMSVYNCTPAVSAGISLASSNADGVTNTFYATGTLPNVNSTETDSDGYGGFINAVPGAMTIEGTRAADGRSIGQVSVLVKAGGMTITRIVP